MASATREAPTLHLPPHHTLSEAKETRRENIRDASYCQRLRAYLKLRNIAQDQIVHRRDLGVILHANRQDAPGTSTIPWMLLIELFLWSVRFRVRTGLHILHEAFRTIWLVKRRLFVEFMLLQVFQGLIPIGAALLLQRIIDILVRARSGQASHLWLVYLLGGGLAGIEWLGKCATPRLQYVQRRLQRLLTHHINTCVLYHLANMQGMAYQDSEKAQREIEFTNNANSAPIQLLEALATLIQSSVALVTFISSLIVFNFWWALVVAGTQIPAMIVQIKLGLLGIRVTKENVPRERWRGYYRSLLRFPSYLKENLVWGLTSFLLKRLVAVSKDADEAQQAYDRKVILWITLVLLLDPLILVSVLFKIINRGIRGTLSIGQVSLYYTAFTGLQKAVSQIATTLPKVTEGIAFFGAYLTFLTWPQPLPIATNPIPVPSLREGIRFEGVWFRYPQGKQYVLKRFDLFIPAGCSLALVGASGSGKSTLLYLLLRFHDPVKGRILWDGIDIREFDPEEYRLHLAAVMQEHVCFDLTVAENIALGSRPTTDDQKLSEVAGRTKTRQFDQEISEAAKQAATHQFDLKRVKKAAKQAGIHKVIKKLPKGYNTPLGDWGLQEGTIKLSGGQRQRLMLARALMRGGTDLFLLDEPTSAMDAKTAARLRKTMLGVAQGRTTLLITHTLSLAEGADLVAVLEDGKVVEMGPPAMLRRNKKSRYAQLYRTQARSYSK